MSGSQAQGMGRRQGVKLEQTSHTWVWAVRPASPAEEGWGWLGTGRV